jgi:hypothetical protein
VSHWCPTKSLFLIIFFIFGRRIFFIIFMCRKLNITYLTQVGGEL